jgi:hypothetical protein
MILERHSGNRTPSTSTARRHMTVLKIDWPTVRVVTDGGSINFLLRSPIDQ